MQIKRSNAPAQYETDVKGQSQGKNGETVQPQHAAAGVHAPAVVRPAGEQPKSTSATRKSKFGAHRIMCVQLF